MVKSNLYTAILILSCLCLSSAPVSAQSSNWLNDPFADAGSDDWMAHGDAVIEDVNGNPSFAVRNGGYFLQEIPLTEDLTGEFMLISGVVSSERIDHDGSITGMPYIYVYEMGADQTESSIIPSISKYLSLSDMLYSENDINEWFVIWDIFPVPADIDAVHVFLKQGEQEGVPQNGSAARFDDLGVYFFTSLSEAESFVSAHY